MTNPTAVLNVVGLDRATLKHTCRVWPVWGGHRFDSSASRRDLQRAAAMLTGLSPAHTWGGRKWLV